MTIKPGDISEDVIDRLSPFYQIDEARAVSRRLLEVVLNIRTVDIVINEPIQLDNEKQDRLNRTLDRLANSEPVQYILGHTWFRDRKYDVNPSVMIPRQETEELVELIVHENQHSELKVLDVGTGSGCIAISLSFELDNAEVHACDVSASALKTAKSNADRLNANLVLHEADILNTFPLVQNLNIIVSNPPYIRDLEQVDMEPIVLEFEPEIALFVSDDDPLLFYRTISEWAVTKLKKGGKLYFEINEAFGEETRQLMIDRGFIDVRVIEDFNGKDRIVVGSKHHV